MNILIGLTGSVATTISAKLCSELRSLGEIKIVSTDSASNFFRGGIPEYIATDLDEWNIYKCHNDSILHIELRKWADVFVIAPLSANTLGKISNGICDNLLTCVAQAWDFTKPVVVAPAMNTCMFTNPTTQKNLKTLSDMGYVIVPPIKKVLACGDDGIGAMAQIDDIVNEVKYRTIPWLFPIDSKICPGIPVGKHPGSFGIKRKYDYHTGVDLYCEDGTDIYACTDGVVVDVKKFTGPSIGHDWWLPTDAMVIDNGTNFILYGECTPWVVVGQKIKRGDHIGKVIPVLRPEKYRPDIPGHSCAMLHLELLRRNPVFTEFQGRNGFMTWDLDKCQPYDLLDPTERLIKSENNPLKTLDYVK